MTNRLRNRLILIFIIATGVPLGITLAITTSLLDQSLRLAATRELDDMSRSLESTGRVLYQRSREELRAAVETGRARPGEPESWPREVADFLDTGQSESWVVSGDRLLYLRRAPAEPGGVQVYSTALGVSLGDISRQYTEARSLVERWKARDLRRGFFTTLIVLGAAVWAVSMAALIWWAQRIAKPIHELTGGLAQLAEGNLDVRLQARGSDEVANAMRAFNESAEQLKKSQERLVYLTRIASWQTLARKMAHEVKNSLTPIRLTMEELTARGGGDRFIEQAAQIVVDEVATLERRVRAFSEFAAEPPVKLERIDVNAVIEDRISLLRNAHPEVVYNTRLDAARPLAQADDDLLRSVLTNLIENAAEAAGSGGVVLVSTSLAGGRVSIEIHDSGPGLSRHARESLFEPTISFKKTGMGLGLSIARRSALLSGGDIVLVDGELGGAAFRVTLPAAAEEQWLQNAS